LCCILNVTFNLAILLCAAELQGLHLEIVLRFWLGLLCILLLLLRLFGFWPTKEFLLPFVGRVVVVGSFDICGWCKLNRLCISPPHSFLQGVLRLLGGIAKHGRRQIDVSVLVQSR
jgi:hypothetical protein